MAAEPNTNRAGIPIEAVSGLQKWEGPDPAYWCEHGYAVVHPDARGANASGGDILFWGDGEARDVEDLLAWIAKQPWSNGNAGMSGNSWLAVSQWYAAARRPAHLKAIAPWEGEVDFYRDFGTRGGIPSGDKFSAFTIKGGMRGPGGVEDIPRMIRERPLWDEYWEDKRAAIEAIEIPAYVVACWTQFHSHGTLDGFRRLPRQDAKWLRVHNTHEWPDYYEHDRVEDLRRFFDRYLKDIDNGWESTPPVRISVLDPGGEDSVDRAEDEWPLARLVTLRCIWTARRCPCLRSRSPNRTSFATTPSRARLRSCTDSSRHGAVGHSCLNLQVEADGSQDMDLFVTLEKLDESGELLSHLVLGMPAPLTTGQLRVSHRETDPERSTPAEPFHPHVREHLLSEGESHRCPSGCGPRACGPCRTTAAPDHCRSPHRAQRARHSQ